MNGKERIELKKKQLFEQLVSHIKANWDGRALKDENGRSFWYSAILASKSGVSNAVISRMLQGVAPSYELLLAIDSCVDAADRVFDDIKVYSNWGKRTVVPGSKAESKYRNNFV